AGFQALTIYGSQYALIVMGLLLVITVLVAPEGIIAGLARLPAGVAARRRGKPA
ncbi:MAG: ABC transporter permease, partial [Rhizobiales bacterium]|nr:ABC transporter permease [Hyphomicrobiales bacterium]